MVETEEAVLFFNLSFLALISGSKGGSSINSAYFPYFYIRRVALGIGPTSVHRAGTRKLFSEAGG